MSEPDPNPDPKLVSTASGPTRIFVPDSPPVEREGDREHRKTIEQENLQDIDPRVQQVTISTNQLIRCGDESCNQPITNLEPFVLLSIPNRGAVAFHMICIGINTDPDNLQDVHWIAHLRRRFIDNLMRDKLYGRRTPDLRQP